MLNNIDLRDPEISFYKNFLGAKRDFAITIFSVLKKKSP